MPNSAIVSYRIGNVVIKIDRSKCISCASCTAVAPQTFELDEDLISKVKDHGPYDDEKIIKEAAGFCAVGGITIEKIRGS